MKKLCLWIFVLAFGLVLFSGCQVNGTSYRYEDAAFYQKGAAEIAESISDLEIHWVSGSVTVNYHDGDHVIITETANQTLTEESTLYYRQNGNTLDIQYAKSGAMLAGDLSKDLVVSLPRQMDAEGNIVPLREFSVETVSAEVEIGELYASECDVETISAEVYLNLRGKIRDVSVESVSGDVAILAHDGLYEFSAHSVSGDIQLSLHGDASFVLEFETVSGELDSELSFKKQAGLYVFGSGGAEYEIETVSGDVKFVALK